MLAVLHTAHFTPPVNNALSEQVHAEIQYNSITGINRNISNVPKIATYRKYRKAEVTLFIRKTGIWTFQIKLIIPTVIDPYEIKKLIHKLQVEINRKIITNMFTSLLVVNNDYQFGDAKTVLFYDEKVSLPKLKLIMEVLGNQIYRIKQSNTQLRITGRSVNILSALHPTTQKSRRNFTRKILQGIHLAHGIKLALAMYRSLINCNTQLSLLDWELLVHKLNPYVLSGQTHNKSPLPTLSRTWFIENDAVHNLSQSFKDFLLQTLNYSQLNTNQFILMTVAIKKIAMANLPSPIYFSVHYHTTTLKPDEEKILEVLKGQAYDEINYYKNVQVAKGLETGPGLAVSVVKDRIGYKSGTKKDYVEGLLKKLVEKGLVKSAPYKGQGRGKNKFKYFLNHEVIDLQTDLAKLIDTIFTNDKY